MDLQLMLRVLWRFRLLVGLGLIAAVGLSGLSLFKVDLSHGTPRLDYRKKQEWSASATIFITQRGFPWGRSPSNPASDPTRLAELSTVYANLAGSDIVGEMVKRSGPFDEAFDSIDATAVPVAPGSDVTLPLVLVTGMSWTPARATALAERAETAFRTFIARQQAANAIPDGQRVIVSEVKAPSIEKATLLKGRSKSIPMVVFVSVMIVVCGLAFMLENLRPRTRPVPADEIVAPSHPIARRSA
jgi:hypothetical protein